MFRELRNFSYRRTPLQAIGWYLSFSLVFLIIVVVSLPRGWEQWVGWGMRWVAIPYDIIWAFCFCGGDEKER
jgi:hypothetical protein